MVGVPEEEEVGGGRMEEGREGRREEEEGGEIGMRKKIKWLMWKKQR